MSEWYCPLLFLHMIVIEIEIFIIRKEKIRKISGTALLFFFQIKAKRFHDWVKELSKVLVSSKKKLGDVEEDLVTKSEDRVGLSFNALILAIRRLTFNNFSRRISSLIVKRIIVSSLQLLG
ncbi:hypothetical protein Tco_0534315 [Tanacetum coccineum]